MKKNDLIAAIEEFLLEQLADDLEDSVIPSVLLLHSVNNSAVKNVGFRIFISYDLGCY